MVLPRGAAPLFLGVEHRGQYEPPQRTEKADVGSRTRTGCVDGTPCGSVSVIRWIIATLRILLVASLPEMRTAHARMSIDGICVQVRGNV